MSEDVNRKELGKFLKARRAALSPAAVGLPDNGSPRRVPGLRREEVAQLASISMQYYTRLEQGRLDASSAVLGTLVRVLRLDEDQRDYVFELAGKENPAPRRAPDQQVRPPLRRLLDNLADVPALVLGRRMDVLAWNPLAAALLTDFARLPHDRRNYARLVFTDTATRSRYGAHWEAHAHDCVAFLRMEFARHPDDRRLTDLVDELSTQDSQFRGWWAERPVAHRTFGTKTLNHPVAGALTLDWECFGSAGDPEQQLVIWTAEPGTPSHDGLRILASWTAEAPAART